MIIIDALAPAESARRLPAATQEVDAALRGRARDVRQRLAQSPDAAAQQAAEELAKAVVSWVTGAVEAVNAEFASATKVGLVLSSARPGLKRIAFVFTDRIDGRRRLECFLTTRPQDGELVLLAEQLGRINELARVGVQDPEAKALLRAAAETFLFETAERFAQRSA